MALAAEIRHLHKEPHRRSLRDRPSSFCIFQLPNFRKCGTPKFLFCSQLLYQKFESIMRSCFICIDLSSPLHLINYITTCHTLKQVKHNVTNNAALIFRSAFDNLSDGVLRFAHHVAPQDPTVDCNRLVVKSQQPIRIIEINGF